MKGYPNDCTSFSSMLRVQEKISTGLGVLQFFTLNAWSFRSDNYASLWNKLDEQDKLM